MLHQRDPDSFGGFYTDYLVMRAFLLQSLTLVRVCYVCVVSCELYADP